MSKSLMKFCNISKSFDVCQNSVQDLADRNNIYGTYIKNDDSKKWVGCPLRVHRRCNDPMFSISNEISYNNLMIQASNNKNLYEEKFLPKSFWLDIESTFSNSHYIEAQGNETFEIIDKIIVETGQLPSLYVISPFRNVSNSLKELLGKKTNIDRWNLVIKNEDKIREWIKNNIGTVHTFQGKEAEIVIFLLGGDPAKEGAIDWASRTPNILNVAVTRAKNLLYVVGDKSRWAHKQNFSDLNRFLNILNPTETNLNYNSDIENIA